jgi:hypothetical protein
MAEGVKEREVTLGARVPESMRWRLREVALWRRTTAEHEVRVALERYLAEAERERSPQ